MSGARFHPLRGHLQLRRAAIIGLILMVEVAASSWLPMAGADDRGADPQAAAELVVRKRILANWRARQDRIKSFYVAWKPGPNDRPPWLSIAGLPGLHQLWVAGDGRFREEFPNFAFGRYRIFDHRVHAFDGKYLRELGTPLASCRASDGTLGKPFGRSAPIPERTQAVKDRSDRRQNVRRAARRCWLFARCSRPYADWTLENSRVTSQNADRRPPALRQDPRKTDAQSGYRRGLLGRSPSRDDLVVHFQRERSGPDSQEWTSIEYKQDPRHGWVPTGWQSESRESWASSGCETRRGKRSSRNAKSTRTVPAETFQIKFPAGAIVGRYPTRKTSSYFVRRDGSRRRIDHDASWETSIKYEQLVNEDTTRPARAVAVFLFSPAPSRKYPGGGPFATCASGWDGWPRARAFSPRIR